MTDIDDISLVNIYYTSSPVFSTADLFGSASPGDLIIFSGNKVLAEGSNYFWVAYNIASGAEAGNHLDAECVDVTFTGITGVQSPTVSDPAGYRIIELSYCIPTYTYGSGDGDYISLVSMGTLYKATGASASPYYNYYQDATTHLVPGTTYQLTVSPGTYSSGNNIAAWIDFNRNGTFETTEKLGEVSVPPMPSTGTITFTVGTSAYIGTVRMRVREVWSNTGIDPCLNYSYGETEDYDVHILPPGCWLGYTNEWNNSSNWSNGVVPGSSSQVCIPEILMGDYYPSVFSGNPVINLLQMEDGSLLSVPEGVTITVGNGQ
jgi:hypothetical protein